jgi:glycosyltransferase involved in cell wall biosynthesis
VSAQTYPAVEHIIVDGGSTDGTIEIVDAFQSSHDQPWISERDEGMYEAINKGLRLARGAIFAYLNSDDLYLPWSIEVAVAGLLGGADLVYGDLGSLERGPNTFHPKFYPRFDMNYFTHFAAIGQPAVFWRAEVTQQIGDFDTRYQLVGDCEYWLRAAAAGFNLTHINEILAIQVEHKGTLRRTRRREWEQENRFLRSTYSAVAGPPTQRRFRSLREGLRWRLLQLQFILAAHGLDSGKWPRFLEFLRQHGVDVSRSGLFWYLLPGRFWPSDLSTLDVEVLEERLAAELGSTRHSGQDL